MPLPKTAAKRFVLTLMIAAVGFGAALSPLFLPAAEAARSVDEAKMTAMNTLAGRSFVYEVAGYKIRVDFLAETKLRWTYLASPDGQTGKTAEETLDRRDIHYGIILLSWTEKDGTNVVDIFDLQTMTLHANAIMPDGKRFFIETTMTEVK